MRPSEGDTKSTCDKIMSIRQGGAVAGATPKQVAPARVHPRFVGGGGGVGVADKPWIWVSVCPPVWEMRQHVVDAPFEYLEHVIWGTARAVPVL